VKKILLISVLFLALTIVAGGHGGFVNKIPNGSVNSCDTCHLNGDFKSDFNDEGKTWTTALAAMDSDGDGFTNGHELLDPNGEWSQGDPDPGNPVNVTNPDDPTDFNAIDDSSIGEVKASFK